MKILVVNAGSSSLKFQLIDMENREVVAKGNVEKINEKGKTVIVVTHDMEIVNRYPHRTVTIENGKIIRINYTNMEAFADEESLLAKVENFEKMG